MSSWGFVGFSFSTTLPTRITEPIRIATPSFQAVVQPDHRIRKFATTNASGDRTDAPGSRNGRGASGRRLRNTPSDSGAPAYMSTLALVISPTSDLQLGNGRKQMQPTTNAAMRPTHGMPRRSVVSKALGT